MIQRKPDVEVKRDGRVWLRGAAYHKMRIELCKLADSHCENPACGKYLPLANGEAHHDRLRGMGGAHRDDRLIVDGVRKLFWLCKDGCHQEKHVPKTVVPRRPKVSDEELRKLLGL